MVQSHVVVEHLVAAEAVLEPLVVPTLQAVALDLDLRALLDARSLVGALEVDPPLLRLVQAVGVVVPGDNGNVDKRNLPKKFKPPSWINECQTMFVAGWRLA